MRYTLPTALFSVLFTASFLASAAPTSQFDAAQERARSDYETAMARIAAESKAEHAYCARHAGPAAKACAIQVDGKHSAAEEAAKLSLSRAREHSSTSLEDREKAAQAGKRQAKVEYGVAKARIRNDRNRANAECSKLKDNQKRECKAQVSERYANANDAAAATYSRALSTSQAMAER